MHLFHHANRRLAYQTHGSLNAAGDNCILLPTYYAGTHLSYEPMIGPHRALDPGKYFIVIPNMLGNGQSSSPSNTPDFTPATIADNIALQHALLAALGVRRIALVHGWSMGAMQSYAWAATYPELVAALLPVCGTASCWPLNHAFLDGMAGILHAAKTETAGLRAFGRAYAGWAYSAAFYRDALYRSLGYATQDAFLTSWEGDPSIITQDDLLAMLHTWQTADLNLASLARITARTIVMPCDTDMYFTAAEAALEAAAIPGAELRILHSPYGHCAGAPDRFPAETTIIEQAITELL